MADLNPNASNYIKRKWTKHTNKRQVIRTDFLKKIQLYNCLQENHFRYNDLSRLKVKGKKYMSVIRKKPEWPE